MTDRRLLAANARVAAADLADPPPGRERVTGTPRRVLRPVVDLLDAPEGRRERQLLLGDAVTVYEDRGGWSFLRSAKDGYVGYVPSAALGAPAAPSHRVNAPATHVYAAPDIKSPDRMALSHGSRITAIAETGDFVETVFGFVPAVHLAPVDQVDGDPVAVAALYLGTPYLWGGNSRFGIDCSGLVQAALLACGISCPGDSDLQQAVLGRPMPQGAAPRRGDLLFWPGHVALVADAGRLLHANAFHMAVSYEPLDEALARIAAQGGGAVSAHRRL